MECYMCPGNCSNCNLDYMMANYALLLSIVSQSDKYCLKGVICT